MTLGAALAGQPLHWRAGLLALSAGLVSRWLPAPAAAGLLALGAAPLWISATDALPGALLLPLAAVLVLLHRDGLPRAVPPLLLALTAVEALRLWLLVEALPPSAGLAGALLAGGVAVAGAASVSPGRLPAASLGLSGGLTLCLALAAWLQPPGTPAAVQRAASFGVLTHQPLPEGDLALVALAAAPGWHALAMTLPPEEALAAGWRPAGAPLEAPERIALARLLERESRGGEGLRLLREASGPTLVWWRVLFERLQGGEPGWSDAAPPEGLALWRLPGDLDIGLTLSQTSVTELLIHADRPLDAVGLSLSGEWFEGPPELEIILDDRVRAVQVAEHRQRVSLGPVAAGPHRILLRFLNDLQGSMGDRNIFVHTLTAE